MVTIPFMVQSTRIDSVSIEPQPTVKEFIDRLAAAGYDVKDAEVRVRRCKKGAPYTGKPGDYVLQQGDAVEFLTQATDLSKLEQQLADMEAEIAALEAQAGSANVNVPQTASDASAGVRVRIQVM